jgi:hypothetical protein
MYWGGNKGREGGKNGMRDEGTKEAAYNSMVSDFL